MDPPDPSRQRLPSGKRSIVILDESISHFPRRARSGLDVGGVSWIPDLHACCFELLDLMSVANAAHDLCSIHAPAIHRNTSSSVQSK